MSVSLFNYTSLAKMLSVLASSICLHETQLESQSLKVNAKVSQSQH